MARDNEDDELERYRQAAEDAPLRLTSRQRLRRFST
jgi:hypothetical protein